MPFTALQLHLYLYPSHCSVMFLRLCRMSTAIQNRHILCVRFLTVFSFINSDDVFKNVDGVSQVLPLVRSFISTLRPRADALSSSLIIVAHHYLHTHLFLSLFNVVLTLYNTSDTLPHSPRLRISSSSLLFTTYPTPFPTHHTFVLARRPVH